MITTEMWEHLNDLYWNVQDGEALARARSGTCSIRRGCQLFYITDVRSVAITLLFSRLGRLIERADKTSRILM